MNMMTPPPAIRPSDRQAHVDFAAPDLPVMLPGRPELRYDLPRAWHHFRELVKNKEETSHVTPIFESLPWRGVFDAAKAFLATARGQEIRRKEPSLMLLLEDRAALRKMPEGRRFSCEHWS